MQNTARHKVNKNNNLNKKRRMAAQNITRIPVYLGQ